MVRPFPLCLYNLFMPEYRRSFLPGGSFFFTVVTYQRFHILTTESARAILYRVWQDVQTRFPFTTDAFCLLPDHLHCIWTLPDGDSNYSMRWREIKRLFSAAYAEEVGVPSGGSVSRTKRAETTVWQRRFWEHTLRDERDWQIHMDYIHYNPVKHGIVKNVGDWPWSSFHHWNAHGQYGPSWDTQTLTELGKLCGE